MRKQLSNLHSALVCKNVRDDKKTKSKSSNTEESYEMSFPKAIQDSLVPTHKNINLCLYAIPKTI